MVNPSSQPATSQGSQQPWRDRFESALHPEIAQFNASIGFDIALLECDLTGSIAHAKMLTKVGILTSDECKHIVTGLETIRQEYQQGSFNPGVDDEDVHFAVEHRLIELIGAVGKKLHARPKAPPHSITPS